MKIMFEFGSIPSLGVDCAIIESIMIDERLFSFHTYEIDVK